MVGLQNNYENIKKEVQALEEHIKCAKAIQLDLEKLSTSKDYMSEAEISVSQKDLSEKQKAVLEIETALLKKQKDIADSQEKLSKAKKIQNEISQKSKGPLFLSKSEITIAQKKIEEAKEAIKISPVYENSESSLNDVLGVQQEALKELECVICLEVPRKDVYSCTQHHIICASCKQKNILLCPICRQDFTKHPQTRNRLAEKMIQKLN